jgi:AcrR family transcriptional regulator
VPRAGLTRDRVIEHAAAVADEVGVDNLTLAAVAQRCGVSLPGLYKHVEGLGAVKRDIALIAVRELTATLAAATAGVAGRDALRELATAYRSYARSHPGHYSAILRAPPAADSEYADAGAAAVSVIASALKGYQLEGSELIHAIRMLRAAFHGMVSLEEAGGFGLPESLDETYAHLINALDTAFQTAATGPGTAITHPPAGPNPQT